MPTLHAFKFLDDPPASPAARVYVLFGDDRFLHLLVRQRLLEMLAGEEAGFDTLFLDGAAAGWADVEDSLSTTSLFSQGQDRVVVIEDADAFVKNYRTELEQLVEAPGGPGRLVLVVSTWSSATRLYKAVGKRGVQIRCAEPVLARGKSRDTAAIATWIVSRAREEHGVTLNQRQARILMELVEWNPGRADQELARLALFSTSPDEELIADVAGGWRNRSIWDAASAATRGKTAEALGHIHTLIHAGEHPLALFAQLSWSLRRYGRVWEIVSRQLRRGQRADLSASLSSAGFRPWGGELSTAEESLKWLGRDRVKQMYKWLHESDRSLKGTHSDPARGRFALERLVFRMSTENQASRK